MLLNRTSNAAKNRNNFSKMMSSMGRRHGSLNRSRTLNQDALDPLPISASRSAPHVVHSTRLRTLATTVFIRGVATRSGKDAMPTMKEPLSLAEFKNEMTTLIDKEVKESSPVLDPFAAYLAELNYNLTLTDDVVTLKRIQGKHQIEVAFAAEEEEEEAAVEQDEEDEEEGKDEEEQRRLIEVEGQTIDLEGVKDLYINTEVKITLVDKMNKPVSSMSLSCSAHENRFIVDTLYSADGKHALHFELFSEEMQSKIYDYLQSLKLDERLGTFISEYTRNYQTHKSALVLNDLKQFMSHLRDD